MQSGSRTDLARLALHDSLAARTETSDRAIVTASTATSASPLGGLEASTAAAVKILTREEWRGLRQLPPPQSQSNAGDTPVAPAPRTASDASDSAQEPSRPPPAAAEPPSRAYGAVAAEHVFLHAAGPFPGPHVQTCLNSGGQRGPESDSGRASCPEEGRTADLRAGASCRRPRAQDASYSSTLHMSNPTQSSLSTVQTLSAIPPGHLDTGDVLSAMMHLGSEPYRMHHVGFPIMEPSPVAGHSPTIISKRAADIFRWNPKETLSVSTPVAPAPASAPASANEGAPDAAWPAPGRRTYRPEAVAEGLEDVSSEDDSALVTAPSGVDPAPSQLTEKSSLAQRPTPVDSGATAGDGGSSQPPSQTHTLATELSSLAAAAQRRSAVRTESGSPHSGSHSPQSPLRPERSAMLVAAAGPESLPPLSGSPSPRVNKARLYSYTPPSTSAGLRSAAADSAVQVDIVDTGQALPRWVDYLPHRRCCSRALSTASPRSAAHARCARWPGLKHRGARSVDPYGGSGLVCDALRTVFLAFLLPVFSWPPQPLLAIALIATLAQAVVVAFFCPLQHVTHAVMLAAEAVALFFALVWAVVEAPGGDEAWCATLACTLPLALLWIAAAAAAFTRLGFCLAHEGQAWLQARRGTPTPSASAASDAASKVPVGKASTATLTASAGTSVQVPLPAETPTARPASAPAPDERAECTAASTGDTQHGHSSSHISAGMASEVTLAVPSSAMPALAVPTLSATGTLDTAEPAEATGTCTEGLSPMTAYSGSRGPPTPLTDRPLTDRSMTNTLPAGAFVGSAAKPPVPADAMLQLSARRSNTVSSVVRPAG